jgi:hypothetical protein
MNKTRADGRIGELFPLNEHYLNQLPDYMKIDHKTMKSITKETNEKLGVTNSRKQSFLAATLITILKNGK